MDSIEKTGGGNFILFLKCETIQYQGGRDFFLHLCYEDTKNIIDHSSANTHCIDKRISPLFKAGNQL